VSEIVSSTDSSGGVQKGFLFRLDLGPNDPPVAVNLGDIIAFIEDKMGAGTGALAQNTGLATIAQALPSFPINAQAFTRASQVTVFVKSFEINSTTGEKLFSFSIDVQGSDPTQGLIPLPAELAGWLKIDSVAIAFSSTGSQDLA
jgi:hypothetical protein